MPPKKRPPTPPAPPAKPRTPAKKPAAAPSAPKPARPARNAARPAPGAKPKPKAKPAAKPKSKGAEPALRIVMVASEAHPFAKTGGLAEVLGALPAALRRLGHEVTVILPRYRGTDASGPRTDHAFPLAGRAVAVSYVEQSLPNGVKAVLVDAPELFDRDGLYNSLGRDFPDNPWRFAVLARSALEYIRLQGVRPSAIHAHDWQTGLVPVYQKMHLSSDAVVGGVPVVFTIHNLAFQGVFPTHVLPLIGLGHEVLHINAMEYWGQISYLKGGINFSEKLTTVSPTYAREILTPDYGFGMQGVLARRAADLTGILNGIDTERWNPETDEFVGSPFSARALPGKRDAKKALLERAGLAGVEGALERPLIGIISRLTDQKGFDLIAAATGDLMALDATWIMLGSGEPHYEQLWRRLAERHPDRVSATIGFDEGLAHMIEAGADIFLMPSRFEPCGLNQLYSLRYGTVPVVRATGGLQDTVVDAAEPRGNGFKFVDYTAGAMVAALEMALDTYRDKDAWAALQREGMRRDSSWDVSAREYVKVYRSTISEERNGI